MNYQRGVQFQRGRGFGSILSGLFRTVFPILKNIMKSPVTKKILTSAKNSAIDAGIGLASDVLSGSNVKKSIKNRSVGVVQKIGSIIKKEVSNKKPNITPPKNKTPKKSKKRGLGRKKPVQNTKRLKFEDVFDEEDEQD